jgi:hypothetical protein
MKKLDSTEGQSASVLIDKKIAELGDWRGETLSRMRKLIKGSRARPALPVEQATPASRGSTSLPEWPRASPSARW